MSFFENIIAYEAGKADAAGQGGGGGGVSIVAILIMLPTLAEMAVVGFTGAVYSLYPFTTPHISFANMQHAEANLSTLPLALVIVAGLSAAIYLYGLVLSIFQLSRSLAFVGTLLFAILWTGLLWQIPDLHPIDADSAIIFAAFFAAIFAAKGKTFGLFDRDYAKRPFLIKTLVLSWLAGPFRRAMKPRN